MKAGATDSAGASGRAARSILFLCTGNICRSPLAEGIVRARARQEGLALQLDSAGTHDYHVGEPADPRARAVARRFHTPIDDLRARKLRMDDFYAFDLILVADQGHLASVQRMRPHDATAEVALLAEWCGEAPGCEVPDPYYADEQAFHDVYALLQRCAEGLVRRLARGP
jgi:protein-tyrosine phosphatase